MEQINVEEIMQEIRKDIADSKVQIDIMPFEDIPIPEEKTEDSESLNGLTLDQAISRLKSEYAIQYYYDMPGGIKSVVKKVIRKSVHFVFFPIMEYQNRFNGDVVKGIELVGHIEKRNYKELGERIKKLERENRRLKRLLENRKKNKE